MARTKKLSKDFRAAALNITDNDNAVASGDIANGVQVINFFENVDNSGALIVANASTDTDFDITLVANTDNISGGLGDVDYTIPHGEQLYILIDDSSRFGQVCEDSDGKKHLGLFIDFETGADGDITYIACGKQPSDYVTPSIA
jgi:hypothetical protein